MTDFSWALINAENRIFNNCNVQFYLKACFDLLISKNLNREDFKKNIKIICYICSTHFLKIIIKKSKALKVNERIRIAFIYFFTLVQNSTRIDQVNIYLRTLFILFNSPTRTKETETSLKFLIDELKDRKLKNIEVPTVESEHELEHTEQQQEQHTNSTLLYFEKYYHDYFEVLKNNLQSTTSSSSNSMPNQFYSPELFIILKEKLIYLPLWTAILIPERARHINQMNRISNNPVELYFSHLKHNILSSETYLFPSQIATKLYARLLSIYLKFFPENSANFSKESNKNHLKNFLRNIIYIIKNFYSLSSTHQIYNRDLEKKR